MLYILLNLIQKMVCTFKKVMKRQNSNNLYALKCPCSISEKKYLFSVIYCLLSSKIVRNAS